MHAPVSAEARQAMRELRALLPPTFFRIARVAGNHVTTVREIASKEGWPKLHAPRGSLMRVVTARERRDEEEALARAEAVAALAQAEAEPPAGDIAGLMLAELRSTFSLLKAGQIDKQRIDALLTLIKLAERVQKLPPVKGNQPSQQEEEQRSDEELAEILRRVDRRIVELARDYAERLVAERADA